MKKFQTSLALCAVLTSFTLRAAEENAVPGTSAVPYADRVAQLEKSGQACEQQGLQSLRKAAAYLKAQQLTNGSFTNARFPGLTGFALWAMIAARDPAYDEAIRKAGDYLLSCAQEDGGIYAKAAGRAGGGLATYNTAVCATALAFTDRTDLTPVMLKAREFLASSQLEGDDSFSGGFGYDKSSPSRYADLMNTHFVMEAMRRTEKYEDRRPAGEKRADLNWEAALAFAERLQNKAGTGDSEGGFSYSPADAKAGTEKAGETVVMRSYGSITYAGLLSLVYCKLDRTDSRVRSALDWAGKHWSLEENPGVGDQGLYFFYDVIGRALSVAGVQQIERPQGASVDWKKELIEKLSSLQAEDGSYRNSNARFWENDPILSTSYAAVSLAFALGLLQ